MKRTPLKPGKPLVRKTPLRPGGPLKSCLSRVKGWVKKALKPVNRARKALAHEEQYGPPDFGDFIRGSGCVVARATGTREGCLGPVQHCHRRSRGSGGLWRGNSFGACVGHHAEEHTKGQKTFEATYGLDLDDECKRLTFEYERRRDGW